MTATALLQAMRRHRWDLLVGVGALAGFAYLAARNAGLPPFVFGDELTYSTFARLIALRDASVPSYLYLWLASFSSACGTGFLDCVRVANALLFAAATPLLYLTARRVCAPPVAAVLALAALMAPANSYTAYFMPEAPYYFGFALLAWTSLRLWNGSALRFATVTGGMIGILMLVKVHALFLLPAQCLFVLAASALAGRAHLRKALATAVLLALIALAIRIGLGYAMAGPAGLHVLGAMYGAHADGSSTQLAALVPGALANLRGHLMGLALMFTFPAALLCYSLLRGRRESQPRERTELQLYAVLMLTAPLAMAVAYTASIYAIEGTRLHMRYYNFSFPLLFMVGAAASASAAPRARMLAAALACALAAAMVYGAAGLVPEFRLSYVDCAELAALLWSNAWLPALIVLQAIILFAWIFSARLAGYLYVFGMLPLFAFQTELTTRAFFERTARPSIYDDAGKFARDYLSAAERAQLTIAGDGVSNLMRAKFHADVNSIKLLDLPEHAPFETGLVPASGQWLLVVGDHGLDPALRPAVERPGFKLVRLEGQAVRLWQVNLSGAQPDLAMAEQLDGFGISEQWGRWSTGKQATLRFSRPLPRDLVLTLHARAFGPNTGQPFILRVGARQAQFELGAEPGDVTLRLPTDGRQDTITILVPQPVSPRALGINPDRRTLGIGLHSILVATPAN